MTSRLPFLLLILFLIAAGLGMSWLRHTRLNVPFLADEKVPVWLVEARVDFEAAGEPVLVSLELPDKPPGFHVVREWASSPGYGFAIIENDGSRRGEWSIREARGPQTLYYKVELTPQAPISETILVDQPLADPVFWDAASKTAALRVLEIAGAMSSTPQSMTRSLIDFLNDPEPGQNTSLLLSTGSVERVLVRLLNQAGIPARLSMGLYLEDARRRQGLQPIVEVFADGAWLAFNPVTGEQGLPADVVLWRRGSDSLLDVMGGRRSQVSFSMISQTVSPDSVADVESGGLPLHFLGIQSLPIEEQSVFKMLLLLPLGALVVVFMRIIVGLRTSGAFMPVLIALAFLQTTLLPGLIAFVTVVTLGLALRSYLSRLNLLLISRIAALLVLVVLLISFLSLLANHLGLSTGLTMTFFPMIVIAWTIERMSILWEEEGPEEVLKQGGGSLLVAVLAYLLMTWKPVGHLTFNFPELNLVLLALILLLGQYTGYKLTELRRFGAFGEG